MKRGGGRKQREDATEEASKLTACRIKNAFAVHELRAVGSKYGNYFLNFKAGPVQHLRKQKFLKRNKKKKKHSLPLG